MKLDAKKFAIACAVSTSILWIICSLFVMVMPAMMLSISGDMMHMELNNMGWHLSIMGVVKGLVGWSVMAAAAGWLVAATYNRQ